MPPHMLYNKHARRLLRRRMSALSISPPLRVGCHRPTCRDDVEHAWACRAYSLALSVALTSGTCSGGVGNLTKRQARWRQRRAGPSSPTEGVNSRRLLALVS